MVLESTAHTLVVGPLPLRLLFVTDPGSDPSQNLAFMPSWFCEGCAAAKKLSRIFAADQAWICRKTCYQELLRRIWGGSVTKHVMKNFCDGFGVDLSQKHVIKNFCDGFGVDLSQNMS